MSFYTKIRLVGEEQCDQIVTDIFSFRNIYYNRDNLEKHVAYLADEQPGRYSHAYAIKSEFSHEKLPGLDIREFLKFPSLMNLTSQVTDLLDLTIGSRFLFNVQEYYAKNAEVPKHFDGELLDFSVEDKGLKIRKAIRPVLVAVMTIVNDAGPVGTRLHFPDGTSEVVHCKPGELLVFDNANCFHSVDEFKAKSIRDDKLIRLTMGWRSLNENCFYYKDGVSKFVTQKKADSITLEWYEKEWPKQWEIIKNNLGKAAF